MDIYKGMHEPSRIEREKNLLAGLNQSPTLKALSELDKARFIDLTMQTDDPENTVFVVIFVPHIEDIYDIIFGESVHEGGWEVVTEKITNQLNEQFDSQYDHAEEIHVSYMNNEWVITYNANR